MLEHEQGDDIAGWTQIRRGVEECRKLIRSLCCRLEYQLILELRREHVAPMRVAPMIAGHIPAAPALLERRLVIDEQRPMAQQWFAARVGEDRAREQARNIPYEVS